MRYEAAVKAAKAGKHMTLPHWCWVYIVADKRGAIALFDEDGERQGGRFRATRAEVESEDWQEYSA